MNRSETRVQDSIVVLGLYRIAGWYRGTNVQGFTVVHGYRISTGVQGYRTSTVVQD
jgi:hypothetical protein